MKEKQLYHKINLASNEGINEVVVAEQDGYLLCREIQQSGLRLLPAW